MFDEAEQAFLRSGCALIVGSASADLLPAASRGWGITDLDAAADRLTVLLDAADRRAVDNLRTGVPVAVTATAVKTLRSLQLKGHVVSVGASEADDPKVVRAYCDDFFGDIEEVDGMHRDILERMVPDAFFRCAVQVHTRFDQTPGPSAGTTLDPSRR